MDQHIVEIVSRVVYLCLHTFNLSTWEEKARSLLYIESSHKRGLHNETLSQKIMNSHITINFICQIQCNLNTQESETNLKTTWAT